MGHNISALVLAGDHDAARAAELDLRPRIVHPPVTVFPVDHYFTAYWGARLEVSGAMQIEVDTPGTFPDPRVLHELACRITGRDEPRFAVIMTEYFGGAGDQWAAAFEGRRRLTPSHASINAALAALGVVAQPPLDAFETIGLDRFRHNPDYLDRYVELCDELGV